MDNDTRNCILQKDGWKNHQRRRQDQVMDLNKVPFVYENMDGFANKIVYYESSRGCPFSCSYCLSSIDKCLRFRDTENGEEGTAIFDRSARCRR